VGATIWSAGLTQQCARADSYSFYGIEDYSETDISNVTYQFTTISYSALTWLTVDPDMQSVAIGSSTVTGLFEITSSTTDPFSLSGNVEFSEYHVGYATADFSITDSFAVADINFQYQIGGGQALGVSYGTVTFQTVPEPSTLAISISAAAALAIMIPARRRLFG
jgi:hypothetical protein